MSIASSYEMPDFASLPSRDERGDLHVVVEAPRGALAKTKYSPKLGTFELVHATMFGIVYPYDFGFIPSTMAEDGDPLDAMVIFDAPTWPGVVIHSRAIGIIRMVQRKKSPGAKIVRNDRVIVVPSIEQRIKHVGDLTGRVRSELESFFVAAALTTHKRARIECWGGPADAEDAIESAARAHARSRESRSTSKSAPMDASPKH